ncbi:MAG: energy-coupling factor ABC transporter ATP-binding protein [Methanotrichaceae archaeon]
MDFAIDVKNLSYKYPDGTVALNGVSFGIERGDSVALLGPNGAGKSTLLLHLNGLLKGEGSVKVLGRELKEENLPWIREHVGLVFQDPDDQLFMPSLWDDVAFGPRNQELPKEEIKRNVSWALDVIGLSELADKCPHNLSFGQKKKAALATVLSMRPEILVMDEPTSNLDPRSKRDVVALMRRLQQLGTTIITATHDVNIVPQIADKILLLDKKVIEYGPTRNILKMKELLYELELEVPAIIDLFESLKNSGYQDLEIPFTKEEALETMINLIRTKCHPPYP